MSDIKTKKGKMEFVKSVLQKHPQTRDNDRLLLFEVWKKQDAFFFYNFNKKFVQTKQLLSPDLITRYRRKIQEQNPSLRGATWTARHAKEKGIRTGQAELDL